MENENTEYKSGDHDSFIEYVFTKNPKPKKKGREFLFFEDIKNLAYNYVVLVIWGGKYSDKFVEAFVKSVKQHSKGCKHIVLITDHIRNDLSDCQSQSKKGPDRGVKLVPFYSAIDITPD